MKDECKIAVRAAAGGRKVSDAKLQAIEDAMFREMRFLAGGKNRERWLAMSREERFAMAAEEAVKRLDEAAALKQRRVELQALRTVETGQRIEGTMSLMGMRRTEALSRDIEQTDTIIGAVREEAMSNLGALIDASEARDNVGTLRGLGMRLFSIDDPQMGADIAREVYANASGVTRNPMARAGAQAYLQTIEAMRQRFNAAGGDIGKLSYGYLSTVHDTIKVKAAAAADWVADVLPGLNRSRYVNPDGSLMSDAQLREFLLTAKKSIESDRETDVEPGTFRGPAAKANFGSEHRELHFADGDAWLAYMQKYGEGTLYDAIMGTVTGTSRAIGLVERYGPNPEQQFRVQRDLARKADGRGIRQSRAWGVKPESMWAVVTGRAGAAEDRLAARVGQDLRNIQTAAKITWGPFAAFGDIGTIFSSLHFNRLPFMDFARAVGSNLSTEHRETLTAHGIIGEGAMASINRWTAENATHSMTGRITGAVMKLTLQNAWTDGLRKAFADVVMHNFALRAAGKGWDQLTEWDRYLLQRKGIGAEDWSVIQRAQPVEIGGRPYLTYRTVLAAGGDQAQQAATKWLAFVNDETQFAVTGVDTRTRAVVTGGGRPSGSLDGEVWRSVMQFKSFPIAFLSRHWVRALETPQGLEGAPIGYGATSAAGTMTNRIALLASLAVTTTLLGAMQTQARAVLSGKDPLPMDPEGEHGLKFWARAFAAGGGAGFLGDVLLAPADDPSRSWSGHLGLAGPVAGALGGLIDVAKNEHHAAQAVRWVSDQLPGVDVWQVRALYEHWFLFSAQEMLNPGYLSRMERRAMKDRGATWWWAPGDAMPDRAPDLSTALQE